MNKRPCLILFVFENNFGGEYVETKYIYNELLKRKKVLLQKTVLSSIVGTGLLKYLYWITKSIIVSLKNISKIRPNIIYTTTYTSGVASILLRKVFNLKVIYHYHGNRIPPKNVDTSYFHKFTQRIKYYVVKWLHNLFVYNADLIIVPSGYTKKFIINQFPKIMHRKIVVVGNGIPIDNYLKANNEYKKIYRTDEYFNSKNKTILSIGRLNADKGFDELIDSFKYLKENYFKKIKLIIITPKAADNYELAYKKSIKEKILSYNLTKFVTLIEGKKKLIPYYHQASLVVSFSKSENLPLTLLEAYASGTVYCSKPVGGVTKVLEKIDPRLLLDNDDIKKLALKLKNIINYKNTDRNLIIKKQLKLVQEFSISKTTSQIYNQIQRLCL